MSHFVRHQANGLGMRAEGTRSSENTAVCNGSEVVTTSQVLAENRSQRRRRHSSFVKSIKCFDR